MDLKQFIQGTLAEIVEGVHLAANEPRFAGTIAPGIESEESGQGGLKVLGIVEAGGAIGSSSAHRVTLSVPVNLRVNMNEGV